MGSEKSKRWVAYATAIIGIGLFSATFISYFIGEYKEFVTSYALRDGWGGEHVLSVFMQSALRFTLRLAYVLSFTGLLLLRRWGLYLSLIAWLGQLLPSAAFAYFYGQGIDSGHIASFVQLLVYLTLIKYCWSALRAGYVFRMCSIAIGATLILHSLIFVSLFNSAQAGAATDDPVMQQELWHSVESGNAEGVKNILSDRSFHPALRAKNCKEHAICNLISYAAMSTDKVEIVRMLHQAGALIDEQDGGSGDTPINRALLAGHLEIAEYLADRGVDPLKTNKFGVPAFIVAASEGSPKIIEAMIKSGAPVNLKQKLPNMVKRDTNGIIGGVTPLMVAGSSGRIDLIETLLKYGADPSLIDEAGHNVFDYVANGKNPGIRTRLDELVDPNLSK